MAKAIFTLSLQDVLFGTNHNEAVDNAVQLNCGSIAYSESQFSFKNKQKKV